MQSVSLAALDLLASSEVIDLHLDTFIWQRIFGYDLTRRHGTGPLRGRLFGHADLPRCLSTGVSGAYWIITTNPFRAPEAQRKALLANVAKLEATLTGHGGARIVNSYGTYLAARAQHQHAAFLGIQGGSALEHALDDLNSPALANVSLVTLLHMTRSQLGAPALPAPLVRGDQGLTALGRSAVRKLNEKRILLDLAHISRRGFWEALEVHDPTQPVTVSHTGCDAVYPHFRNLDDAQLKAVAARGGVVGIMFHRHYLTNAGRSASVEHVAEHIVHMLRVIGPGHVALGSDFDGFILPPRDLRSIEQLPRLVEALLRRHVAEDAIRQLLGANFLRVLAILRP